MHITKPCFVLTRIKTTWKKRACSWKLCVTRLTTALRRLESSRDDLSVTGMTGIEAGVHCQ